MILIPTRINNRQIIYLDILDDLRELSALSLGNWVLFVIEDDKDNPVLIPFAGLCIEKDVVYVCCAGKACSEIDDLFDMEMVCRIIDGNYVPRWFKSEEDILMTTWHHDFDEGFWFAAMAAEYDAIEITEVVIVNLTKQVYLQRIEELTKRISEGWGPS